MAAVLEASVVPYSQMELNFRKMRDQLEEEEGW